MNVKSFISCAIVITIAGCTAKSSEADGTADIPELPVIRLSVHDTTLQHSYVTDIQAVQNVEIRSKVQGYLEKIFVDEGKEVQKGQPLFKLNDQQFQLELSKAKAGVADAQAEVNAAELEIKRVQLLVDKKIISKTELGLAQAKLKSAQAKLSAAEAHKADAVIHSQLQEIAKH